MDSVLGSIWMIGVVLMSGGLALVGLTQETNEPVHLDTRSLVWADDQGRQLGDVLELEHVQPQNARVLVSYDGGSAMVQLERGDRLWLPCPTGPNDWITFSANGRVIDERRVTGCSPSSTGSPSGEPSPATDDDASEDPATIPCPQGTRLAANIGPHAALRACVPIDVN